MYTQAAVQSALPVSRARRDLHTMASQVTAVWYAVSSKLLCIYQQNDKMIYGNRVISLCVETVKQCRRQLWQGITVHFA